MEEILSRALDFGLWVHGEYLRKEILGEPRNRADLVGSPHSIVNFLGWYGHDMTGGPYLIKGYLFSVQESALDIFWWVKYAKPVLSCDSFYRTKHVHLGVTNQKSSASKVLDMTRQKRFMYLGHPLSGPGIDLVLQGWVPLSGPERVVKEYLGKLKVLLYLGLRKIPFDLVNRICQLLV